MNKRRAAITYLVEPLSLRTARDLRYCHSHREEPLHLVRCADATAEESEAWIEQLKQDGVLQSRGGWFVLGATVFCNPRLHGMTPLYFYRKRDAEKFLLEFASAQFSSRLCRTGDGQLATSDSSQEGE